VPADLRPFRVEHRHLARQLIELPQRGLPPLAALRTLLRKRPGVCWSWQHLQLKEQGGLVQPAVVAGEGQGKVQ
jgi:hypothetical protein